MSNEERRGWRDLTYNIWHRPASLKRFIGHPAAYSCAMIDIDGFEYCRWCYEPLALIETARQRGGKNARATATLARKARIPAYSLLYQVDDNGEDRCDGCGNITHHGEIVQFWLSYLWPRPILPQDGPRTLTPQEWALCLYQLRANHFPECPKNPAPPDLSEFVSHEPARDPKGLLLGEQVDADAGDGD